MTQLIINIENPAILPSLKKILGALDGVSIAKTTHKKQENKTGLEEAIDDIRAGRVSGPFDTTEALFKHLEI